MIHDVAKFAETNQCFTWTANINFPDHSSLCSAYNTKVSKENLGNDKAVKITFNFSNEGHVYFFEGMVKLSGKYSKSSREIHINIFRETDPRSSCIYSSILSIPMGAWLKMLFNIHVYNATGMMEKRKARQLLNRYFFK
jgi:hypothetical protein